MKAVQFVAPETIVVADVPKPVPGYNEVLARVAYAGFCGTDIELLTGEMIHIKNGNTTYPLVPGHEWAGVVEAVGAGVTGFAVGDRVTGDVSLGCGECPTCREGRYNICPNREVVGSYRNRQGVFAEYVAVPQRHLYPVPEGVSLKDAALAEPAGTAAYAVKRAGIGMGDEVLVIGDGPIGQLAAQLALVNGAGRVHMAGSWDEKLGIAQSCGVSGVINYHREDIAQKARALTGGAGPRIVIETSGNNSALNAAVAALRPGGNIVMVSWYNGAAIEVAMNQAIAKDCNLIGTLASPNTFGAVLGYMAAGRLKPGPLVTHVYPLEAIEEVIGMIRAKKECRIKVLLKP